MPPTGQAKDPDPVSGRRVDGQRFNGGWPQRGPSAGARTLHWPEQFQWSGQRQEK